MPTSVLSVYTFLILHSTVRKPPRVVPEQDQPESPKIPPYKPIESQKSQHEERHGMPTQPGQGQLPRVVELEGTFSSQQSQVCAAKDGDAAMRTSGLEPGP